MKRCAIYTRKSTDCVAEQEINSLQGQRAVCSAYIKCQEHKGWSELPAEYDDEGYSGKNLDRPALHKLLTDAREGRIDVIVFYKIDRLTRSLSDFVRLMDSLRHLEVAFVSVTQSFDTSDSMGRMILNILLTFAQFEREMMGDRIRDKKAMLKRKGLYVGRSAPIGYVLNKGRLTPHPTEAELVRDMFERVADYSSICGMLKALDDEGARSLLSKSRHRTRRLQDGSTYKMLRNPLYFGYQMLDGELIKGGHQPIVSRELWEHAQLVIEGRASSGSRGTKPLRDPLVDLIFDDFGRRLGCCLRGTKRWPERYYETSPKSPGRPKNFEKVRVIASDAERLTRCALLALLETPEDLRRALVRGITESANIDRLIAQGRSAAERLRTADAVELRSIYEAIVTRIEVSRSELRIWLAIPELAAFLNWSGVGRYQSGGQKWNLGPLTYLITVDASLHAPHHGFRIVAPVAAGAAVNRKLVALILNATHAQQRFLDDPSRDLYRLASEAKTTVCRYSRLLRLNYLAPDIKAAILDGRQPPGLTPHALLYAPLPADWQQQRALLGFERPPAPSRARRQRGSFPPQAQSITSAGRDLTNSQSRM